MGGSGGQLTLHAYRDLVGRRVPVVLHREAAVGEGAGGVPAPGRGRGGLPVVRAGPDGAAGRHGVDRGGLGAQVRRGCRERPPDDGAGRRASPPPRAWPSTYADATHTKTVDAHRLLHLASTRRAPAQAELKESLLAAYFTRGESMGDHDVLAKAAVDVGLDPAEVGRVLTTRRVRRRGRAPTSPRHAPTARPGCRSSCVDQRYGISGAQPVEVFTQTLEQAWADAHPAVTLVGGEQDLDGQVCGPDGCY